MSFHTARINSRPFEATPDSSASPQQADIDGQARHVADVPEPDVCTATNDIGGCTVYSITSSAATWRSRGTLRPSILAVLRLMTNSKRVDCVTGRSPGFSPLRILPT